MRVIYTCSPKFFNLLRNKNQANTNEDTSRVYYTIYLCKQKNSYPFQLSYFSRDFQILSNTSRLSLNFQSLNSKHFQYYPKYIRSPTNPIRKDRANKTNRVVSSCFCVHDRKKKKEKKTRTFLRFLHPQIRNRHRFNRYSKEKK